MRWPNWVKTVWWLLLVAFSAYLLSQRYEIVISGTPNATDIIIFIILIALLVIPLFQEVNIFGVGFKKEIDNLRTDFRNQILDLRSDIQNTINMRTEISPQIYLTPPTDSELSDIEERIRPVLERIIEEQGIERPTVVSEEPEVPNDTRFLFSVRYSLEKELRRLATLIWPPYLEKRPQSILSIANILSEMGKITPQVVNIIREVYAICSAAVHGNDVSEASVKFVRDTSPALLAYLKSIQEMQWPPKE
jgi:hypothetical protein